MLGSDYRELIVPKLDNSGKAAGILIGGGLLTLVLAALSFLTTTFLLFLATAAGVATWYFWTQERIEYEYIISGDQLDVTKIIAQSKRKPMLTVSIRKFESFCNLRDAADAGSRTLVLACSGQDSSAFCADFDHEELGATRLVFTPNDDILLYLSKHLPRNLGFRWEPQKIQSEQ